MSLRGVCRFYCRRNIRLSDLPAIRYQHVYFVSCIVANLAHRSKCRESGCQISLPADRVRCEPRRQHGGNTFWRGKHELDTPCVGALWFRPNNFGGWDEKACVVGVHDDRAPCQRLRQRCSATASGRLESAHAGPQLDRLLLGVNAGYGWKDPSVNYTPNDPGALATTCGGGFGGTCIPPASFSIGGAVGGGQVGYNWQFDQHWLAGFEADYDAAWIKGTGNSIFTISGPLPGADFQANE